MCCCIPLYKLMIGGATMNIIFGLVCLYTSLVVLWTGIGLGATEGFQVLVPVFLYTFYLWWFLPLGSLMLWATLRKSRRWIRWIAIILLLIQLMGSMIQIYYKLFVSKMIFSSTPLAVNRKVNPVREIIIQSIMMLTYLGTVFFFHRELDDSTDQRNHLPPPSTNNPTQSGLMKPYANLTSYHMDPMAQQTQPQYPGHQQYPYHFQQQVEQQIQRHMQQNRPLNNMNMNYQQQV